MAKATHSGTCQLCGSLQKLPNGRLSQHGYTTRWGFFEGVCYGSKHLPFELSCDLIQDSISTQRKIAAEKRAKAAEYRAAPWGEDHATVWLRVYDAARDTRHVKAGYIWVEATITAETKTSKHDEGYSWLEFSSSYEIRGRAHKERVEAYGVEGERTLANVLAYTADKWAKHLEQNAASREEYADWQANRIKNWKAEPSKLHPVKAR